MSLDTAISDMEAFLRKGLEKKADGILQASRPEKITGFLGIQTRRKLSKAEEEEIARESAKAVPRIFRSGGDPLAVDLSSPAIAGGAAALSAALPTIAAATLLSKFKSTEKAAPLVGLASLPIAAAAGLWGYYARRAANRDRIDYILRMPPGSTRRDLENNPEWAVENDTQKLLDLAKTTAASRGVFKVQNFSTPGKGRQLLSSLEESDE